MTLSDTQRLVLTRASQHPQLLAAAPPGLPAAARDAVFRAMLRNGLLAECAAPEGHADLAWRMGADGTRIALRATAAGLCAIGVEPKCIGRSNFRPPGGVKPGHSGAPRPTS